MNGTYDIGLVILSIGVAVIASYVALDLAARVVASRDSKVALYWFNGGAISMGTGIWSMHFIGMLAFRLPIPMSYDIPATLFSLLIAMIVSGIALYTVSRGDLSVRRLLGAGLLMGIGIASMHYTGMAAMQMEPPIRYDPLLFVLSVLIAIVAAMAALWIAFQLRSETILSAFWKKAGSALVMGAAISGMHYTGMAAAIFAPNSFCTVAPQEINNVWLAGTIGGFTFMFLIATLLISVFDARLAGHSAKLAETLRKANVDLVAHGDELARANASLLQEARERKQAEERLRKVDRARKVMAECNRVMVHAGDETRLLQDMCRTAVESGGYRMAWVGYAEHDEHKSVRVIAQAGFDAGYLEASRISWGDNERGRGPSGRAIRSGRSCVVRNVLTDPDFAPWRENAVARGFRSHIALPLASQGAAFGVLSLYTTEVDAFDTDEVALLEELAADLAYGIVTLRTRIEHARAEALLLEREAWFRATFEQAGVGMGLRGIDPRKPRWLRVNQKLCDILGYTREELLELSSVDITPPEERQVAIDHNEKLLRGEITTYSREKRYVRKDGRIIWADITLSTVNGPDGRPAHIISVIQDITERKQATEQLNYLAQYDTLTGLPNRNLFRDRLTRAMARAKRNNLMLALMFLDLDRFKEINDTLGHTTGNAVLQAVARVMKESLREVDTIARLGGDEFTLVLEDIIHVDQATALAEKILLIFTDPLVIEGREIYVTASVGITLYPSGVDGIDALLQTADIAMHHAKEEGRNIYEFYAPEMNAHAAANLDMENLLRRALERREFTLHYQPKVSVKSGRITGVEALIRWNSKELGSVPPARFIPLAEKTGLIVPIGEWVLKSACAQNKAWQERGFPPLLMSVNLSPRQFRQKNLLEMIAAGPRDAGLDPRFLELEITESMIMLRPEKTIAILQQVHQLGVQLSVDDFGTGYSSLAYLKRFPVQRLKIDQSFVRDLATDPDDDAIVTAVIAMAKSLELAVVAEGVETAEQLAFLVKLDCEEYQGYYFSRPLPADEFARLLPSPQARVI